MLSTDEFIGIVNELGTDHTGIVGFNVAPPQIAPVSANLFLEYVPFKLNWKRSDMLSTDEFIGIVNELGTDRQKSLLGNSRTNWNDQIYQTAFGTDNNLSVSGRATSWLPFRVSAGAYYQDGILKTDNAKRFTGAFNVIGIYQAQEITTTSYRTAYFHWNSIKNNERII